MNNKVVAYYRDRKGGKSLDYQQKIAADWISERGLQMGGQVIETEGTSKRNIRPIRRPSPTRGRYHRGRRRRSSIRTSHR